MTPKRNFWSVSRTLNAFSKTVAALKIFYSKWFDDEMVLQEAALLTYKRFVIIRFISPLLINCSAEFHENVYVSCQD